MKRISCGLLFLLTLVLTAAGANSVTLAWNPNTETNLAGYRLYWGTATRSYQFSNQVSAPATFVGTNWVQSSNTFNVVSNLDIGRKYYFAVTAFTSDGLESDYSEEVMFGGFKPGKPTTLRISGATNQTAAIWIENTSTSTTVQWSGDLQTWRSWAQVKTLDSSAPVGDAIFLSGISPDAARFWRAVADSAPATIAPASLPGGIRLTPLYPPLPSANP